ncbi:MAG: GNAT family N-acetyltransferase [Propionibacteriaceae bacterium]
MTLSVRPLTADDAEAARQLGFEAFGVPTSPPTEPASVDHPGRSSFGAFDGETLVAKIVDRDFDSYYGGVAIPTAGIAGVTVAAEYRGRGALGPLFTTLFAAAKERGAVISTLFPTAPRIYRRFGYEVVADFVTVRLPTSALASVRPAEGLRTRRAMASDVAAIRTVYDTWAAEQNGPLTRRGPSFPGTADEYLAGFTGVTVAVDAADVVHGYASWNRGQGYGEKAVLEIEDLLAIDAGGYRALMLAMGSFSSVTYQTKLDTSGDDIARTFLPSLHWEVVETSPYMLRVLDVGAALSLRRYPTGFEGELAFQLAGDFGGDGDGGYILDVGNGRGNCLRAEHGDRIFTPQGLALMYAGTQSSANLRVAGHLSGGDVDDDSTWDALFGGRQQHIRNYF